MFQVDGVILAGAILVLVAIASSKFSERVGLPVLVLFVGVGMLAGSEGLGGIAFEDYPLAHGIATVALALILFNGGLHTSHAALRVAWKPAFVLATLGVLVTSLVTGVAAAWVLDIPLLEGFLLGSIVGSTDAAAVFAVLRSKGARLAERLNSTLEIESGSNDPMAIFLTVGLLDVLLGETELGPSLVGLFALQMSVGGLVGVGAGRIAVLANKRINLDTPGLYPVMMAAAGLFAYGVAASVGGSGFLATYVAGIVLGNSRIVFQRGILMFSDAMAWLSQIVMFTMMGLLAFPSRLVQVVPSGLALSAVLIAVARPIAVFALLPPFRYDVRETLLVSWVGLRGAVPIILATYPLLVGLPDGRLLFNVVFFVVLVSAVTQGWTLPWVASRLGLQRPLEPQAPASLEITSLRDVSSDIVAYVLVPGTRAAGRRIRELSLPQGAVVAMIARGQEIIPPRGSTRLAEGDHAFVVVRPEIRPLVDRAFSSGGPNPDQPLPAMEFPLSPRTRVSELVEFYGIQVEAPAHRTLEDLLRDRLGPEATTEGAAVDLGNIRLVVRQATADRVEVVGLQVLA